jgi:hypothetical protein
MPRTLKKEDMELRRAIRAEKDGNPSLTHREIRDKFSISQSSVVSALGKTVAEWDALLGGNVETQEDDIDPQGADPEGSTVFVPSTPAKPTPVVTIGMAASITWKYKAIVVKGRAGTGAGAVYEIQEQGQTSWQGIAPTRFQDLLDRFGRDGWELVGFAPLQHGATSFIGLFELVFKRPVVP